MVGNIKVYTDAFIENEAEAMLKWFKEPDNIWLKDFAELRGYSPNRFEEWEKQNIIFSGVYLRCKAIQESKLVKGGLTEQYNAGFAKFLLVNMHKHLYQSETKIEANQVAQAVVEAIDYKNALDKDKGWQKPTGQETTS